MTIKGLDTSENLAVVSAGDQNLCARADSGLENGEGASGELMLFDLRDFVLGQLRPGLGEHLLNLCVNHDVDLASD